MYQMQAWPTGNRCINSPSTRRLAGDRPDDAAQREMFDEWVVLRDDQVIRKRWIVCAVAPELVAAIESPGRRRRDFDDDFGIDDHIAILI